MGIPDHLFCLLRNLYEGQEATVRTGHGTKNWFQIGKGGCILSHCLFNLYAEYIMRNAGLKKAQAGIRIAGRNTNNLRYANDTTLMAENAANQVIENKGFNNFDVGDMLIDGAIGGVSGALGGAGKGTKHLTNLGKQTVKRTFNATTHRGLKSEGRPLTKVL